MSEPSPQNDDIQPEPLHTQLRCSADYERFLTCFMLAQDRLQSFIRALVHDRTAADDVFQTTSLELWRRYHSFQPDGDFTAWALGIARHKVLHYWRSLRRDRHVFSDSVLSHLADLTLEMVEDSDPRQAALAACVELLPHRQRQLITLFYEQQKPAADIAIEWKRSVHAVYKALKVLRRSLLACIEGRLSGSQPPLR